MANEIPITGLGSAGLLLPEEQGQMLTNGVLSVQGALQAFGDSKTTNKRKAKFNIWKGKPTAGPVGEGARKPVTGAEFGQTDMDVQKFASIVIFSDEQIEDLQDGDMNVLVDSGVRDALAESIDAHALGKIEGVNIDSVFTTAMRETRARAVEVDLSRQDGVQKAVSSAMGVLEDNGYGNPANMHLVLGHGFQQILRDAEEDDQATGASKRRLYSGNDPFHGVGSRSISTNLNRTKDAAGANNIVGFLAYKPNGHLRLRTDVRVKASTEASIEIPAPTEEDPNATRTVHLYQDNLTAIRYELRLGAMWHDADRAIVPLTRKA